MRNIERMRAGERQSAKEREKESQIGSGDLCWWMHGTHKIFQCNTLVTVSMTDCHLAGSFNESSSESMIFAASSSFFLSAGSAPERRLSQKEAAQEVLCTGRRWRCEVSPDSAVTPSESAFLACDRRGKTTAVDAAAAFVSADRRDTCVA